MAFPPLIKILAIFSLVLVLNRIRLQLGLAILAGALAMGLWFGHGIAQTLQIAWEGGSHPECLLLLATTFSILSMAQLMNLTGLMQRMIGSVRALARSRRVALAALPALMGLLSMPGGAAVSAPMVDAVDEGGDISPSQKTAINYWFRHVWEYWWPVYPGALLAYELSKLSIGQFAAIQMPLTFFSILFGVIFLLMPLKLSAPKPRPTGRLRDFLPAFLPILILIVLWPTLGKITNRFYKSNYLPMLIALGAALIYIQFYARPSGAMWKKVLKNKSSYLIVVVVLGVKIFSKMLESKTASGAKIVDLMGENLREMRISEMFVVMAIPFVSGLVTGLGVGFVGSSFPIVMSLAAKNPAPGHVMSYVVLAFGFGYIGMMLSPVHVCFVVSNEYFKTPLMKAYQRIGLPAVGILLASTAISLLAARLF